MYKSRSAITRLFIVVVVVLSLLFVPQVSSADRRVISNVTVITDYDNWGGPCPKVFKFIGTIQLFPMPGAVVNYHWERSDGAKTALKIVHIRPSQNELVVEDDWTLGASGQKYRIYETLVVESGNQHIKERSKIIPISCQK